MMKIILSSFLWEQHHVTLFVLHFDGRCCSEFGSMRWSKNRNSTRTNACQCFFIYHSRTREGRHEELVAYAIRGAVEQVRRAYDIASDELRAGRGALVVVADDAMVARHERLSNAGDTCYDWQHYMVTVY